VVLVVALLGLFALSSLMIDQKLKDVAIKKTLGASDNVLIRDLTKIPVACSTSGIPKYSL
jgi:putative ABC transport system permease protein